jgi:hypothetical protein
VVVPTGTVPSFNSIRDVAFRVGAWLLNAFDVIAGFLNLVSAEIKSNRIFSVPPTTLLAVMSLAEHDRTVPYS